MGLFGVFAGFCSDERDSQKYRGPECCKEITSGSSGHFSCTFYALLIAIPVEGIDKPRKVKQKGCITARAFDVHTSLPGCL